MNHPLHRLALPTSLLAGAVLLVSVGCAQKHEHEMAACPMCSTNPTKTALMAHVHAATTAVATIQAAKGAATQPSNQNVAGTVTFTEEKDGLKVVADLTALSPGKHGIHIHDKADLTAPDLTSAGGHWDPDGHKQHGGPITEGDKRHAGDLGNLEADASGKAHYELTITGASIGGKNDIVGHSVIIHAKEDDMKSNPAGNAGGRVAGGVIAVKGS